MLQQINLYNALPKKPKEFFTPQRCLQACAGFAVILIFIFISQLISNYYKDKHLTELNAQKSTLDARLAELKKSNAKPSPAYLLKQETEKLTQEIARQKLIIELLSNDNSVTIERGAYANYLLALAKLITPEVWLKSILITQGDKEITLTGSGLDSPAIMQFVHKINNSDDFARQKFNFFKIENAEKNSTYVNFTLSTNPTADNASTTPKNP